jgi:hypothetical protein
VAAADTPAGAGAACACLLLLFVNPQEARDAISEYQRTTAAEETARKEKETAPLREVSR